MPGFVITFPSGTESERAFEFALTRTCFRIRLFVVVRGNLGVGRATPHSLRGDIVVTTHTGVCH